MTKTDVITIGAPTSEVSREKLRDILRAQQSTPIKFMIINDVVIYYHYLVIRSDAVLFKLRLKSPIDDVDIPFTVAMMFYNHIHSIIIYGKEIIYE